MRKRGFKIWTLLFLLISALNQLQAQGNKLNISATTPKNMSVCGFDDTTRIAVYNISSSVITGVKITVILPAGVTYIPGSIASGSVSESNISNLNRPVFSGPNLLIAQNFNFRINVKANCDIIPLLSGNNSPQIDARVDYTGNFDLGGSNPFVPIIPSPGFASITNSSIVGNVGDKFIRKVTLTNYGKGPLTSLRFRRISGSDLSVVSQTGFNTVKSGDTLTTWFSISDFNKVGDKDTLLEQNESVTITDTFTINGCNKITTYYELGWGCGGKICQLTKNNASVTISSDNPNIKTWTSYTDYYCYDGTTPNPQFLTVTNTGKKAAKNLLFNVFVGTNSANTHIDTLSVFIKKGANSTKYRLAIDTGFKYYTPSSCVTASAINYITLDLGTLAPGDTLYLTWNMFRCASPACGYAFYDLNWLYNYSYRNQCNSLVSAGNAWGKVYTYSQGSASPWVPTDLNAGETKDFQFTFNSFYPLPMTSRGRIRVDMVLPKTLEHNLNKSDFFIIDGALKNTWYPDSIVMRGDTLRGYFGSRFKINLSKAEMTIRLKGTCAKYSGNTSLPVSMSFYYNPDPACNPYIWIRPVCVNFTTKVHCSSNCNVGLWFKNFEARRTSFGLPDNDNNGEADGSGTIDPSLVRRERLMYGDTMLTVFTGRPKTNTTYRNWRYGYAESYITYGNYVDVIEARLEVYKGNNLQSGTCNTVRVKKTTTGAHATFRFDFTVDSIYPKGCLSSSYRFSGNDSIRLIVRYRVSQNIGGTVALMNFSNRFYFGSTANPTSSSQIFQCDTFGANMLLYGYYYANCCSDNVVYSNCAERSLSQSWYLGIGPCCQNYAGNNIFPWEFRNFTKIKAVRVHLPSGFKLVKTYFGQYRTTGVGSSVLERKDTIPAQKGTSNPYVFDFRKTYTDSGGNIKAGDDGVQGYFTYTVQPRCNLPANTPIRIDYDYIFERQGTLGTGYDTLKTGSYDLFTFNPPDLKLSPAVPVVYAYSDTVEWEVRYTNPSTGFDAYNVWLSPKNSPNIKVVEIRDADADTTIKPDKDIFKAGVLRAGKIRRFKVRAVYNSCNPDSLILYGSYNCAEYPVDFASYPCSPNSVALYLEPQNTRLQLSLTDSASTLDLCATNKMTLLLENIQAVNAFNTKVRVSLPIGMQVIGASAQLKYPISASPQAIGAPKLVSGTIYEWDLAALSNTVAKGFKGTSDTAKNKLLITFRVVTNCDYASGSFVSARALANIKCGNPIPAIPAFSNPQDIKGVTRPYYTLVKSWADTLLPCQKPMMIKSRVVFLGPGKSGTSDRVEIFLPAGVSRDTSFWNDVRNAPHKDSITVSNINGATLLSWKMKTGITPGDSMEFDIRVTGDGSKISCGPMDIITRSVVVQPVICVSTGVPCDIKVITGSELANPWVDKGDLRIENTTMSSRLVGTNSEEIQLEYEVRNAGRSIDYQSPVIIRYHYDKNNSGKLDSGDVFINSDTFNRVLKSDSFFIVTRTFNTVAGYSCGILGVVDSSACACLFSQTLFPQPQIKNAGNDTAICSGNNLTLGSFNVPQFAYSWDNDIVLDSVGKANPAFIAGNQRTVADTHVLVLTTTRGFCSSKDTVQVLVYPVPDATVLTADTSICAKTAVLLSATVSGGNGGNRYQWQPTVFTASPNSLQTLAVPDSATRFYFAVTDSKGCTDRDSVEISTFPFPKAWFTWPVTCQGKEVQIADSTVLSKGFIKLREWVTPVSDTFGVDTIWLNTGSASAMPVSLMVESDIGCTDTVTRLVDVKANPLADFEVPYVCAGDSSRFVNKSAVDSGIIVSQNWFFGDGQSSSSLSPAHRYNTAGDYTARLSIMTNWACTDTFAAVARSFPNPRSDFSFTQPCEKDSVEFTNASALFGDTLKQWSWDFGKYGLSALRDPAVFIDTFGVFRALLQVETIHGCIDTVSKSFNTWALPKASYTIANHCLAEKAQFTSTSTIPQGSLVKYNWFMGEGGMSSQQDPSYDYLAPGTYTPKLIVTSDKGCSDSTTGAVDVWPLAHPSFSASSHCYKETLTATSAIHGGGVPVRYTWHTGSGDSVISQNLNWNYAAPGAYTVRLITLTDKGCVSDTQALISVYPLPVVTAANSVPCNDDSVVLTGGAIITNGFIQDYTWNLSEGPSIPGRNIRKIFQSSGDQWATLVATSDKGCIDSASVNFRTNPKVIVDFTAADVCLDEETKFTNLSSSTEPITKYSWKFGDGRSSSLSSPVLVYRKDGTFNAELSIETKAGCIYTFSRDVVVHPKPIPGFDIDPKAGTILNPDITITDMSSGADSLWYVITDGYTTLQRSFVHTFPDSGSFRIWQINQTTFGCMDSVSEDVFIHYMYTLFVPNTFTPNSDTKNEYFGPDGLGIKTYEMQIYSRWGELVYQTENSRPWDGFVNGKPAPLGVYAVLINIRDYKGRRHTYKGTVTLIK